jgi:hypothetical protein
MDNYQAAGAGSPFTFFDSSDINMDLAGDQSAFINGQQQTMHSQPTSFEHSPVGALTRPTKSLRHTWLTA